MSRLLLLLLLLVPPLLLLLMLLLLQLVMVLTLLVAGLPVLLLLVERRISRKHGESQLLSNSRVRLCGERESQKKKGWKGVEGEEDVGMIEGAEGKGNGDPRKVKGLEEQGILQEIQKKWTGEGVDAARGVGSK